MSAPSTMVSQQHLIDAAKAPILAYNDKDWDALRTHLLSSDFVYDEVATGRKARGADVIPLWQGWAGAFPDSKATVDNALATDNAVILEVTWRGTHKGQLQTPGGPIDATENRIEIRACFVVEMSGDRIKQERHYFDMGTILQQLGITA
jgi:steroid delta-isomerase-like uncharacterized protein